MKMVQTKTIECAPVWWEISTSDVGNVAGKFEIRVSVEIDGSTYVFQSTPTETLRILLDFFTFYKWTGFCRENVPDYFTISNSFETWKTRNYVNLEKIVLAYRSNYNPIENYNGTMEIIDESETETPYTRTKTISGKIKQSQDIEQKTKSGGATNSDTVFSDSEMKSYDTTFNETTDPGGAKLKERNVQNPLGSYGHTTVNPENNYTTWDNYSETETETGGKKHTENRHGNLGVTTSQSMVEDELKLRKHDILKEFLYQYVADCLYM